METTVPIPISHLISREYVEMQRTLHAGPQGYGSRGDKWAGVVLQVAMQYDATSILDYGCGEGTLARELRKFPLGPIRIDEYDPAIPGKDDPPDFADLVNVTDVLEHIEPDRLEAVLAHLKLLARKVLWVVVCTQESHKVLTDGRNAHLIVRSGSWWKKQLKTAGFNIHRAPSIVRVVPEKEWAVVLTPAPRAVPPLESTS